MKEAKVPKYVYSIMRDRAAAEVEKINLVTYLKVKNRGSTFKITQKRKSIPPNTRHAAFNYIIYHRTFHVCTCVVRLDLRDYFAFEQTKCYQSPESEQIAYAIAHIV